MAHNRLWHNKLVIVAMFAVAMGYLEATVVVYLRQILYPEGFCFPLKTIPTVLAIVELGREAATIVMLAAIGILAGNNRSEKTAYFLYSFGIWDIFYYIWLKTALGWPESLLTDDILFLIPVVWVGPVLAPVVISLTMIGFAWCILKASAQGMAVRPGTAEWALIGLGITAALVSFMINTKNVMAQGMPKAYHWELLIIGEALAIIGFIMAYRAKKTIET